MSDAVYQRILQDLDGLIQAGHPRLGVVTTATPLAVDLGASGSPFTNMKALSSYTPVVGDTVLVSMFGYTGLVLGAVGSSLAQRGLFSAYRNAALSLATGNTVLFDTEERDLSGWYDPATGRFTPQTQGYYRLSWSLAGTVVAGQYLIAEVFKNGALHKLPAAVGTVIGGAAAVSGGSIQVVANGTTDYFSIVLVHNTGGSLVLSVGASTCYFQGEFIVP